MEQFFNRDWAIYESNREMDNLDWAFAGMITRHAQVNDQTDQDVLKLVSAMTLASVRAGHSCLDLNDWAGRTVPRHRREADLVYAQLPAPLDCRSLVAALGHCHNAVQILAAEDKPDNLHPLLLIDDRFVYLNRFRRYELEIADFLNKIDFKAERTATPEAIAEISSLHEYFSNADFGKDGQMQAVFKATDRKFAVITGGPGTGKTTIMVAVLARELQERPYQKIILAAPTGKAAERMKDSILDGIGHLHVPDSVRNQLQSLTPYTLHSLLGISERTGRALYNREHRLDAALLVVDECSMTSLELFSQLFQALPEDAHLLLLGDQNQLTSVESGVVFGEICDWLLDGRGIPAPIQAGQTITGRQACISVLTKTRRFSDDSALAQFVQAILVSPENVDCNVLDLPQIPGTPAFQRIPLPNGDTAEELLAAIWDNVLKNIIPQDASLPPDATRMQRAISAMTSPQEQLLVRALFECFCEKFKILCAVRNGSFGVAGMNALLGRMFGVDITGYPDGLPILITRNDTVTGLRNGDMGICCHGHIWFPLAAPDLPKRPFRGFLPAQLPEHERAFAMTIHKSQGSDYNTVIMVLPGTDSPILSRELIYTGITRTKPNFFLLAAPNGSQDPFAILKTAIRRPTRRWSALQNLL